MATRDISDEYLLAAGSTGKVDSGCGTMLVTGRGIAAGLLEPLVGQGMKVRWQRDPLSEDELGRQLKDVVAYLHGGEEIATEAVLRSASETLRVVAFLGVGYENFIDVATARALGIAVTSTPGAATESVASFTIAQILNAMRAGQIGHDQRPAPDYHLPHELRGREVGIVGMGAIGTRIAEILVDAFGAKVRYFSRTRKHDLEDRLDIRFLPLRSLTSNSDILVVMVPLTDDTRSMIGAEVLESVRPGTILVNTARPAIVEPKALHRAMSANRISVAVFDGFYGPGEQFRPPLDGDLESAAEFESDFPGRLLITPHIASQTREAMDRMVTSAVASIQKVLAGEAGDRAPSIGAKRAHGVPRNMP